MTSSPLSQTAQDYLKEIYKLQAESGVVETSALPELVPGEEATIERVPDGDAELLRYLSSLHLLPGERVELVEAAPFGGPVRVMSAGGERAISRELAAQIGVS